MPYIFKLLDKANLSEALPLLFRILHTNMSSIAPTGNSYDQDYDEWYSNVFPAMQRTPRQMVLMYDNDILAGYFQYYVSDGTLMMEEIQILPEYHGCGMFREFYSWLLGILPKDVRYVEAYSHKSNLKSQGILEHLGLSPCGENKNGSSYHYKGEFKKLSEKYGTNQ